MIPEKPQLRRPQHGFSLIELLVVIAVISLLVSILLPSLNRAKDLARRAVCASQIRSYGLANEFYANEYDDCYCPVHRWNGSTFTWRWRDNAHEFINMIGGITTARQNGTERDPGVYCPGATHAIAVENVGYSYGLNSMTSDHDRPPEEHAYAYWPRGAIRKPAIKLMMADAEDYHIQSGQMEYYSQEYTGEPGPGDAQGWHVIHRHDDGLNGLMFDGHVEYISRADFIDRCRWGSPENTGLKARHLFLAAPKSNLTYPVSWTPEW